ncbi:MAG: DUF4406 domain-containing protein [Acidaminococcaceae bacterium]|nr:DUF4406 domain-containing protein [Acidaminococcaceae bacterium]
MKTVYVAHPFRGDKDRNREDAKEVCILLKELNPDCCFVSPLDAFRWADDLEDREVLEMCKELVIRCDAIYLCTGWENSEGCRMEKMVAELAGKEVLYE